MICCLVLKLFNCFVLGMYSSEGEFVEFVSVIDTEVANGNVDQWLVWVEE